MNKIFDVECPICSSNTFSVDNFAGKILGIVEKYEVLNCLGCNHKMLYPQLSDDELERLYSESYFDNSKDVKLDSGTTNIQTAAMQYEELILERYQKFTDCIEKLKKLNPAGNKILDVGAASGDFVKLAKDSGLNAYGIEHSEYGVEKAMKTNNVKLDRLSLSELEQSNNYDFIHLNHVYFCF